MAMQLPDRFAQRLARCVLGLGCFGLGISMLFASTLGTGPWDVFHKGLAELTGLSVGVTIEVVGLLILLLWIPLHIRPGIGTILNAIQIGLVVDLIGDRLPVTDNIVGRLAYVLGGTTIIALGSGLYIGAGLGSGPRDGLMLGLEKRGISLRLGRTIVEATALALGWLMGGTVGIGTVIFLVAIGPMVQWFLPRLRMSAAVGEPTTADLAQPIL